MKKIDFNYTLPEGKAKKPYYQLTEKERIKIGRLVFERATREALGVGQLPVTGATRKMTRSEQEAIIKEYKGNAKKICKVLSTKIN